MGSPGNSPDGSQAPGSPVFSNGLVGPGRDGNDHVWISNFANPTAGIVELAAWSSGRS
jgi:hypothetical protein